MKTGHRTVVKGKRVIVHFRDGTKVIDRFVEFRDSYLVLQELGRVPASRIRSVSIYKG